jgi:DNA-directed RNA polymerase specialized sigma24 family protein
MPRYEPGLLARLADLSQLHRRGSPPWPDDPVLGRFTTAASAAEAADDPDVFAALILRRDDELATRAALAAVATRLLPAYRRWCRCGLYGPDLADAEAQLAVEALAAMRSEPTPSVGFVVARALHRVYGQRRTERVRAARRVPLRSDTDPRTAGPNTWRRPLAVLGEAIASGVLTAAAAATLWASLCGWSSTEASARAGCSPEAWRARKARAARALAAAGLVSIGDE